MAEHPINPPRAAVNHTAQLVAVTRPITALSDSVEPAVGTVRWLNGVTWSQFEHIKPLVQSVDGCDPPDFTVGDDGFVSDAFGVNGDHDGDTFVQPAFTIYRALTEGTLCHTAEELVAASDYQLNLWISMAIAEELITAAASGGMGLRNSARVITGAGSTIAHKMAALIEAYGRVAGASEGFVHASLITSLTADGEGLSIWNDGLWNSGLFNDDIGGGGSEIEDGDITSRYYPIVDLGYTSTVMNGISGYTNDEVYLTGPIYMGLVRTGDLTHTDIETNRIEVLQQTHVILVFDPMTVVAVESTATQSAFTVGAPPQAN